MGSTRPKLSLLALAIVLLILGGVLVGSQIGSILNSIGVGEMPWVRLLLAGSGAIICSIGLRACFRAFGGRIVIEIPLKK